MHETGKPETQLKPAPLGKGLGEAPAEPHRPNATGIRRPRGGLRAEVPGVGCTEGLLPFLDLFDGVLGRDAARGHRKGRGGAFAAEVVGRVVETADVLADDVEVADHVALRVLRFEVGRDGDAAQRQEEGADALPTFLCFGLSFPAEPLSCRGFA